MPSTNQSRRAFLATSAGAVASAAWGASDAIALALIGAGRQGRRVASRLVDAGARFKTVCELDPAIRRSAASEIGRKQYATPRVEERFEGILDDREIDGVVIAAPDHWHARMAMMACQAGKDVYCESPLCHTVEEGRRMRDAALRHRRILQSGLPRRSGEHFRDAAEWIGAGRLGRVSLVKAWITSVQPRGASVERLSLPVGLDADRWFGPAPYRPADAGSARDSWRLYWNYSCGELGGAGIHALDFALWGIQELRGFAARDCMPSRITAVGGAYHGKGGEVPDTQSVSFDYGDLLLHFELGPPAPEAARSFAPDYFAAFYGTDATMLVGDAGWELHSRDGRVETRASAKLTHEENFLQCIRKRTQPNAGAETGRLSAMLCQLGNISYRLGRSVRFDPASETFRGDCEANSFLTKAYRAPYFLPEA